MSADLDAAFEWAETAEATAKMWYERTETAKAALATSQAYVTRLVAELAESVRALAVSQGEAELWKQAREVADQHRIGLSARVVGAEAEAERLRGDLERAREEMRERCAKRVEGGEWSIDGIELAGIIRSIPLAPPTPTASPEPDRASPEVTVKENDR